MASETTPSKISSDARRTTPLHRSFVTPDISFPIVFEGTRKQMTRQQWVKDTTRLLSDALNAGTVVRWREQTLSVDQYLLVARHAAPGTAERLLLDQYVVTNDTKLSSIWNLVLSHPDLASKATVLEADGGSLAMLTCSQSADSSGLAGILVHGLLRTSLWQSPERAARLLDRIIVDGERSILPGYHVEEWIGFELTGDWTITPGTILSPTEDPPRRLRPYDGDISLALRNVRHEHRATMLTVEQAFNWGPIIYAGTEPPPFGAQLSRKSEALTISNIMAICSLVLNSRIDVQCKRHMHEPEELWDVTCRVSRK